MTIEDDLRSALHHHADQVEPSADGLERIQDRLDTAASRRPRLAPRLLAAAALLLVVGALGATTLRSSDEGEVAAEVSSSTSEPVAGAVINELPPRESDDDVVADSVNGSRVVESVPTDFQIPSAPAGVLGPPASSPEAAVHAFLGLIQRGDEDITIEIQSDLALVSRVGEGGDMVDVTTLTLGSVEGEDDTTRFVVVEANAPNTVIDAPSPRSTSTGSVLAVSGQGEGFEAQVDVYLYSSRDGVWLNRAFARAGNFGVLAPFETQLDVSGSGPAWLVVQAAGATNTKLDPFSAVPVNIDAPRANPEYLVTNIPANDPDGGLVVRSLPGTDGTELVVLPASQGSVYRRAALSAFIGDGEPSYGTEPTAENQQEWWNIWLPEPLESGREWGWVNASYLATADEIQTRELQGIGTDFVLGLQGDDAAFASLPWSDGDVTVGLTSDVRVVPSATLIDGSFWSTTATWTLPEAFGGTEDATGRELLSPTQELLGATEVAVRSGTDTSAASPFGNDQALFAAQFPEASYVQIFEPDRDSGWVLINIFVNEGENGLEIVGVVATPWTP